MTEKNHAPRGSRLGSPGIGIIVAVVVFVLVALAVWISNTQYLRGDDAVFEGERDPLPAGAGRAPDGAADMERGGLTDGTLPDDAVDQTINADNTPALLQEGGDPAPERSAEGLEPIGDNEAILPEIAEETDMNVPGVDNESGGATDDR